MAKPIVVIAILAAATFLTSGLIAAVAEPTKPIVCQKAAGMIAGPLVPTKEVAIGIFMAIAQARESADTLAAYDVNVADEQRAWVVFQALKKAPDAKGGGSQVTRGGGGLAMTINKCNGAISEAHWQK